MKELLMTEQKQIKGGWYKAILYWNSGIVDTIHYCETIDEALSWGQTYADGSHYFNIEYVKVKK